MKKLHRFTVFALALGVSGLCTNAFADTNDIDDRFSFDLEMGDGGAINPSTFIPLAWNKNWFSGVGYRNYADTRQDSIDGFAGSKVSTQVNDRRARLNFISYQKRVTDSFSFSAGIDYEFTQIDKSEFGFFTLGSTTAAFDNTVKINVNGINARGDITWGKKDGFALLRLGAVIAPANRLSVDQKIDIPPLVASTGKANGSLTQDMGYLIRFDSRFKVLPWMNLGIDASYELLPLKYDAAILDPNTLNSFTTGRVDVNETTTRVGARFIILKKLMGDMYPVLGVFNQKIEAKDNVNGSSKSETGTFFTIGFTAEF